MICHQCGKDFYPENKRTMYCSYSCSSTAKNKRRRQKKLMYKKDVVFMSRREWQKLWRYYHEGKVPFYFMEDVLKVERLENYRDKLKKIVKL